MRGYANRGRVAVTATYFDTSAVAARFGDDIEAMSRHFTSESEQAAKYRDVLFMLAPFYHRVLPFRKIIFLDADLKFR